MIKAKFSYETAAELAAIVAITAPYALPGGRTAEKQGKYSRIYITFDPEKIAKMFGLSPARPTDSKG